MAAISYKCSACGGPLKWDAEKQCYFCEYCRSKYTQEQLDALKPAETEGKEVAKEEAQATYKTEVKDDGSRVRVYSCPSCGAEVITSETTASSVCYYCHNPIVLQDNLKNEFHPDAIIPFAIDNKKAKQIFKEWVGNHKYIPKDFYSDAQVELLSGVYFPYWIYNAKIHGSAKGKGYVDRVWMEPGRDGDTQCTETSIYTFSKSGDMPVNNISRIALGKASKVLCESVAPFDYEKMRPFEYGYLSGYLSEARDIDKIKLEPEVKKEVEEYAKQSLVSGMHDARFNRTEVTEASVRVLNEDWKYVLMPVWTLTYKGRDGKMYYFSINGDSGKTVGELPVEKNKLISLFFKTFIPVAVALLALFHFLG